VGVGVGHTQQPERVAREGGSASALPAIIVQASSGSSKRKRPDSIPRRISRRP
jgi:hypothetical protein